MEKLLYKHTDNERLDILRSFFRYTSVNLVCEDSLFSEYQVNIIENNLSVFEKLKAYKDSLIQQEEAFNNKYNQIFAKAKTFVVHYYMAMFMAIERGELPTNFCNSYGLAFPFTIPNPRNGEELIKIAKYLFDCDAQRIANGGRTTTNPTITSVKIWVEKFEDIQKERELRQKVNHAEVENIDKIRENIDNLIIETYDKAQEKYAELSFEERFLEMNKLGFNIQRIIRRPRNKYSNKEKKRVFTQLQFPFIG